MSETHRKASRSASDEDLLADAIPIEEGDDEADTDEAGSGASSANEADELAPIDIAESDAPSDAEQKSKRIHALGDRKPHEDHWKRKPNVTGEGAIHVKTFISKLRYDAIEHLDEQVNH
jgi:hypothetical protein